MVATEAVRGNQLAVFSPWRWFSRYQLYLDLFPGDQSLTFGVAEDYEEQQKEFEVIE